MHPHSRSEKKIISKGKTNFLIKNPAASLPRIFFYKFLKFSTPSPQICEKIEKILTYTPAHQLFYVKISKFLNFPLWRYEFLNFCYLRSHYSGWGGGGVDPKKFFRWFYIKTNILAEFQSNRWKFGFHRLLRRDS